MPVIEKASKLLSSRNAWVKEYAELGNRMCLWGALRKNCEATTSAHEELMQAAHILYGIIEEQYPERYNAARMEDRIIQFNDHRDTVFTDIRTILEKAVAKEEELT